MRPTSVDLRICDPSCAPSEPAQPTRDPIVANGKGLSTYLPRCGMTCPRGLIREYNPRAVPEDAKPDGKSEITCLIVDDHEVVREGLRLSLSRAAAHPRHRRGVRRRERRRARGAPQAGRRDHGRADARHGRARGDEAPEREGPGHGRPHLHRVQRAQPPRARPRVGREGLHPQGGAAPDAAARDREGRRRRGLRRSGADARVPARQGRGHAHRRASGRSSSCSPTACPTRTSRRSSSSARRP